MKKCKECGERNKYGYHLLDCKWLADFKKQALAKHKEKQQ